MTCGFVSEVAGFEPVALRLKPSCHADCRPVPGSVHQLTGAVPVAVPHPCSLGRFLSRYGG